MGKRIKFDRDKAVELYKSGSNPSKIAKELGVGYQVVLNHLKKQGVYTSKDSGGDIIPVKKLSLDSLTSISSKSNTDSNPKSKTEKKEDSSSKPKTKKEDSNLKPKTINQKQKTKTKKIEDEVITLKDKIEYCNEKYGEGNWHFMTKEEFIEKMLFDTGGDLL